MLVLRVGWIFGVSFVVVSHRFSTDAGAFVPAASRRGVASRSRNFAIASSTKVEEIESGILSNATATTTANITEEEEQQTTTPSSGSRIEALFPGDNVQVLTIELIEHVPLGCTVEESLNEDDNCLFVSKLTKEGNAEKAGLKVGDVVVGMTGLFGELTGTLESDVEQM